MENAIDLLGLLHDTGLKEVKFDNDNLELVFEFYLEDDIERLVELKCTKVSSISILELFRENIKKELSILELNSLDLECLKVEMDNEKVEIVFNNYENDSIIVLKYISSSTKLTGDTNELKMFWDYELTV